MSDWFNRAFNAALIEDYQAALKEARLARAEGHGQADPLDRVLREKLLPERVAERAFLQWLDAHHIDREPPDEEPERDHGIDR